MIRRKRCGEGLFAVLARLAGIANLLQVHTKGLEGAWRYSWGFGICADNRLMGACSVLREWK